MAMRHRLSERGGFVSGGALQGLCEWVCFGLIFEAGVEAVLCNG